MRLVAAPNVGAGDASRRASVLAAAVLCLLLATKAAWVLGGGGGSPGQVPFVAAAFVLPLLYVFAGIRRVLSRYRWLVLAVQGVLTSVPFALFGSRWEVGIGGLMAGMVLLAVAGRVSWLAAGGLLTADVVVRAAVVGLPFAPAWSGALWAVLVFVDDTVMVFGMVRLAQLVGEQQSARAQAAALAAAAERLAAAGALQSAIGERLAVIINAAADARQALPRDAALARAQIMAAGMTARQAVAGARALTASRRSLPPPQPAPAPTGGGDIGARVAWAVLVVLLAGYAAGGLNDAASLDHDGARLTSLVAIGTVVAVGLQLRHSRAARQGGKPRGWPLTVGLQLVLAYVFFLPSLAAFTTLVPFAAGSVLLLVPRRVRWAGYIAVIVSWSALYAAVPLHGLTGHDRGVVSTLYLACSIAQIGLLVYGLSRLAGLARELEVMRGELARMAGVRERLRVMRDVHDLLGLGLSAVALKTDLIGKLISRDDVRAAGEIEELARICTAARADLRLVTSDGQRLSLAAELAAARHVLTSAGIDVRADIPAGPLPAGADLVLAPVLREAATNILRHAAASTCTIQATTAGRTLRLTVSNDGVASQAHPAGADGGPGRRGGSGLANLTARLQAAGGRLATRQASGRFELTAEIPVPTAPGTSALTQPAAARPPGPAPGPAARGR